MANFTTTGSDTFPAGHIVQTVFGTPYTSENYINNTNWNATGLDVTIDPIFTNSKIMITHQWVYHYNAQNGNCKGRCIIKNDTSGVFLAGSLNQVWRNVTGTTYHYGNLGVCFYGYETLSTGSAQTYQMYASADAGIFYFFNGSNYGTGTENIQATIMAQEIKV